MVGNWYQTHHMNLIERTFLLYYFGMISLPRNTKISSENNLRNELIPLPSNYFGGFQTVPLALASHFEFLALLKFSQT